MCYTFPILPPRGSVELRSCDRCFEPEWIPFPFIDLLILRQFWPSTPFRLFRPEGFNISLDPVDL